MYNKPIADIILNGDKLKVSSKFRNKTRVPTLATFTSNCSGNLSQLNWARKRNSKKHPNIKKVDIKLSIFVVNIILYIENPKNPTKKLLEITNESSKVVRHKNQYFFKKL